MPRPTNVKILRAFPEMTSYLRQYVEKYSVVAAPLTSLLHNKASHPSTREKFP